MIQLIDNAIIIGCPVQKGQVVVVSKFGDFIRIEIGGLSGHGQSAIITTSDFVSAVGCLGLLNGKAKPERKRGRKRKETASGNESKT